MKPAPEPYAPTTRPTPWAKLKILKITVFKTHIQPNIATHSKLLIAENRLTRLFCWNRRMGLNVESVCLSRHFSAFISFQLFICTERVIPPTKPWLNLESFAKSRGSRPSINVNYLSLKLHPLIHYTGNPCTKYTIFFVFFVCILSF